MMNPLRCGSMPLRSRDNAWNVTTHTAARIACCYCAINFNFGLQPSKENSAARSPDCNSHRSWMLAKLASTIRSSRSQQSLFPGNYFCPQRSCAHIATEPVCLKVRVVGGTEAIEVALTAWQWRTKPPEAHMEFGCSQRWECWERKPGAENHIARIRCQRTGRSW
jgi:hypothetical protein